MVPARLCGVAVNRSLDATRRAMPPLAHNASMKIAIALLAAACGATAKPAAPIANTAQEAPRPAKTLAIWTTVVDSATDEPIPDALVVVLRPGVDVEHLDPKQLEKQAVSRGRSNGKGTVHLAQRIPVPGTYSVVVVAAGYEPLVGKDELRLDKVFLPKDAPDPFDPWGKISLHSATP